MNVKLVDSGQLTVDNSDFFIFSSGYDMKLTRIQVFSKIQVFFRIQVFTEILKTGKH